MSALNYLPLLAIGVLLGTILLASFSGSLERLVSKIALSVFGRYLTIRGPRPRREQLLQAAYIGTPYRVYESNTLLYSTITALSGSVLGVYIASATLLFVSGLPTGAFVGPSPIPPGLVAQLQSVPELSPAELFSLLLISSGTVGVLIGLVTYRLRWLIPELQAGARRRRIELSMPRMIALMYALSRGGLGIPRILRILDRHQAVYGESAREMAVAGKAIDVFGMDTVSALRHVSHRTPSDQFRIFAENLTSVLQSGRSIPAFLSEQYEQYQEEAEVQQEVFLDRLGAIAEGYVALIVVGPLFLITILLIFGLISGGTESAMRTIIYLLVPLLNLGFIYYLDHTTQPIDVPDKITEDGDGGSRPGLVPRSGPPQTDSAPRVADGGVTTQDRDALTPNLQRLAVYDRFKSVLSALTNPLATVRSEPGVVVYATVPIAGLWILAGVLLLQSRGSLSLLTIDEYVVQALFIVFVPFAIARYFYTNRLREIERVVPDLFNRLASLNESGVEIVNALEEVQDGDLGILTPEMARVWTDIEYGMDVQRALHRLQERTRAPSIRRAVTLITNAMKASGNIGPVLRIAADESRRLNSLKQKRESDMSIYLVITYLSFLVFLTIIFVLVQMFIPAIPSREVLEGSGLAGAAAGITRQQAATFTMLLFHASIVQATFSGLIAGQMSQGNIRDGAVHVVILLLLAYTMFSFIG
jgi:flagellar protein FlaJ